MEFTKEQLSELICKHTEKENGLHDLMEIMLESLMVSERREYLQEEGLAGNKCNGYRPGRTYGHGRTLTFRIPRDRYGNFHQASISRMLDYLRRDVTEWLGRSLESHYPVAFIDCVHIKIHRKRSVDTEAFYVVLAVKEDKTREVCWGSSTSPRKAPWGGARC